MNKINGYTEEEARGLVKYVCDGRKTGAHIRKLRKKDGQGEGERQKLLLQLTAFERGQPCEADA